MPKVLVVGDLAVEIIANLTGRIVALRNRLLKNFRIVAAGAAGNMAWYLQQLGIGPHVVRTVGDDSWQKGRVMG